MVLPLCLCVVFFTPVKGTTPKNGISLLNPRKPPVPSNLGARGRIPRDQGLVSPTIASQTTPRAVTVPTAGVWLASQG